ncbi:hypothetical protein [Bacillus anthracis]|uniref:hypothetical protein n=1 Tax=Bacillus anthracis TaxID=1392 RepID=UPI003D24BE37
MNNLFMVISILGGLASLALIAVLLISLFVEKLKPLRKKLTIALVTAVILCIVGGTIYGINLEVKARIVQETETTAQAEKKKRLKPRNRLRKKRKRRS